MPEACPCNPFRDAPFGACDSGFVCSQPWTAQAAAAARQSRRLLLNPPAVGDAAVAGEPEARVSLQEDDEATGIPAGGSGGFVCAACMYGMLCPRGSVLPPVLDPSIQM